MSRENASLERGGDDLVIGGLMAIRLSLLVFLIRPRPEQCGIALLPRKSNHCW